MGVVLVGERAFELLHGGVMITFATNAPPELAQYSILVEPREFHAPIQPGDIFEVDGRRFPVVAVGRHANETLRDLAHAAWCFDGAEKAKMPGEIHLVRGEIPPIVKGTQLAVLRA